MNEALWKGTWILFWVQDGWLGCCWAFGATPVSRKWQPTLCPATANYHAPVLLLSGSHRPESTVMLHNTVNDGRRARQNGACNPNNRFHIFPISAFSQSAGCEIGPSHPKMKGRFCQGLMIPLLTSAQQRDAGPHILRATHFTPILWSMQVG